MFILRTIRIVHCVVTFHVAYNHYILKWEDIDIDIIMMERDSFYISATGKGNAWSDVSGIQLSTCCPPLKDYVNKRVYSYLDSFRFICYDDTENYKSSAKPRVRVHINYMYQGVCFSTSPI